MPLKLNSTIFLLLFYGMYAEFLAIIQQILQKLSSLSLTREPQPTTVTLTTRVYPPVIQTPQPITRPSGYYFRYYRTTPRAAAAAAAIPTITTLQTYKRRYLAQIMKQHRIFRPVSRFAI